MIEEIAPAKINLYLHVGAVRSDGLHELCSLFVFAEDGDRVRAAPSDKVTLEITGPFGAALQSEPVESNLVYQAAQALRAAFSVEAGAALVLDKRLPVAAGVGGGSADAAATLRALIKLWNVAPAPDQLKALAFELGADVPACLTRAPLNVSGAGEILAPGPSLPPLWVCLANTGVKMPTGPVFNAYDTAHPSPPAPQLFAADKVGAAGVAQLLRETRNDLQAPAIAIDPGIGEALAFLNAQPNTLGARMSGSGATCFALFEGENAARDCENAARTQGWWAMAAQVSSVE